MNIFYLDNLWTKIAAYHCDKHVVKMPLETAQILCTVLWENGYEARYRQTHKNHPVVKWAGSSYLNYDFTINLGLALCEEYRFRYSKTHACREVILDCYDKMKVALRHLPYNFTEPPQCMPDHCKVPNDPVQAYRNYYMLEKRGIATWNKSRAKPSWYTVTN